MLFDGFARRALGFGLGEAQQEPIAGIAPPDHPTQGRPTVPDEPASGRPTPPHPRIGLALGAGAARGWAHIGVLRALEAAGIRPHVIAGCSVGAVVGGCYAAGKLDQIEAFARSLTKRRVMGLLDFHITGSGLIGGERLRKLLEIDLGDSRMEALPLRFATVATELTTGHEIWLTRGPLVAALRASYALPGVFDPVKLGGRWLMDGALVNPVPVTVARALGADLVICINLNGEIRLRGTVIQTQDPGSAEGSAEGEPPLRGFFGRVARAGDAPGIAAVMIDAFNITQDRIARSRLAGDPPDLMIAPKLQSVGLFEFHRAAECIDRGEAATRRVLEDLRDLIPSSATAAAATAQAVAI